MDTKYVKEQFDCIAEYLKSKASSDNNSLIFAMSTMFKVMLDVDNTNGKQIEDLTSTINGLQGANESLNSTITELQETIKDLR